MRTKEFKNDRLSQPSLLTIIDEMNVNLCNDYEVQPVIIHKHPKFPTRERHLAIRRRKTNALLCCGLCDK